MSSRKRKTYSLQEASEYAWHRGLLGSYYALDSDTTASLRALLERTRWRQSASSLHQGHGRLYAFHQALLRYRPRPRKGDLRALQRATERAESLEALAFRLRDTFWGSDNVSARAGYQRASDAFEIAADAWEEANDMYRAVRARRNASQLSHMGAEI